MLRTAAAIRWLELASMIRRSGRETGEDHRGESRGGESAGGGGLGIPQSNPDSHLRYCDYRFHGRAAHQAILTGFPRIKPGLNDASLSAKAAVVLLTDIVSLEISPRHREVVPSHVAVRELTTGSPRIARGVRAFVGPPSNGVQVVLESDSALDRTPDLGADDGETFGGGRMHDPKDSLWAALGAASRQHHTGVGVTKR